MAKKKNSRELDELQVSPLDDKNFLERIIEAFCQRCQFHFLHNLLDLVPKKRRKEITAEIRRRTRVISLLMVTNVYFLKIFQ